MATTNNQLAEQSASPMCEKPGNSKDRNGQLLIILGMIWLTLAIYVWHSWEAKETCAKSLLPAIEKTQ